MEAQKNRSSRRVRRWSPNPLLVTPKAALLPGADENGHFQPGMNDPCCFHEPPIYIHCYKPVIAQHSGAMELEKIHLFR